MEARHGVKVGSSYLTNNAAKEFVHFIAKSLKNDVVSAVSDAKFFSLFLDGSTDKGNVDNELLMVCWCDLDSEDEKFTLGLDFLLSIDQVLLLLMVFLSH